LAILILIFYNSHSTAPAAAIDPTSYYPDFWNYASFYGEEAARLYYTVWSPPVGTPPPPGIVLPAAGASTNAQVPLTSEYYNSAIATADAAGAAGVASDYQYAAPAADSAQVPDATWTAEVFFLLHKFNYY
jgi:hypothetical protein